MSSFWLADECRQQAILFLAAEYFAARRKPAGPANACPKPLFIPGSYLDREVGGSLAAIARDGDLTIAKIVSRVDGILHQHCEQPDAGIPAMPGRLADLVLWWLKAGRALSAIDPRQRTALVQVMRKGSEPMHPALWCAERYEPFSLSIDHFAAMYGASEADATPVDCRRRLFLWVMSTERPRRGVAREKDLPGWVSRVQSEMREIGDDAVSLFGEAFRLRTGAEVSLQTIDKWVPMWATRRLGERVLNEIRRPVIYPTKDRSMPLAKGVVMLQSASALVAELAGAMARGEQQGGNMPALARATAFACSRWRLGDAISTAWDNAVESDPERPCIDAVEPALLAVGRWLTSAQIVAEVEGPAALKELRGELIEASRIALALDGFQVREVRGAPPANRIIPHASGMPDYRASYELVRDASGFKAPLGTLDEPASCPARLFAAIEAVDWRLWAFGVAPRNLTDEMGGRVTDFLRQQVLQSDMWEVVKRQALHTRGVRGDEESLAKLFDYANQRRLALEFFRTEVYGGPRADAMLEGLITDCAILARESLAVMVTIDPELPSRLEPPRLSDGAIDVSTWLARGGPDVQGTAGPDIPHRLRWCINGRPRGELLAERRAGAVVEVVISAGEASGTELAMLNGPVIIARSGDHPALGEHEEPGSGLAELIARFRAGLAFPTPAQAQPSVADAITGLRRAFSGDSAAAFHELITRWREGDEAAAEWCHLLRSEPTFEFTCHPVVDLETGAIQPPSIDDEFLVWEYDATVPLGEDVAVRFAMTPAAARRVLSLGSAQQGALNDRTDSLVAACLRAGGAIGRSAEHVRKATHRWLTFSESAPHPLVEVQSLLEEILRSEEASPVLRTAAFAAAAEWCESFDHVLMPQEWKADGRLVPTAFADLPLVPEFDDRTPTGTVVVRRFGLRGVHGWPFSGAVSAGPAPVGFHDFRAAIELLGNCLDTGAFPSGELVKRVDDLAKHALSGTLPLALPNLFDRLWETVGADGEMALRPEFVAASARLFEILKNSCRMVPFEPAKLGEYPAGWVREADGAQPRGRRIKRVVRPGLRTLENVLVRPALLITE